MLLAGRPCCPRAVQWVRKAHCLGAGYPAGVQLRRRQRPKLNAPGGQRAYRDPTSWLPLAMIWLPGKLLACVLSAWARLALLERIQAVPLADIAHLRASPARAACEQSCLCATKIASALTFCSMPMNPAAQSPGARHFPADLLDVAGLAAKDQEGRQRGGVGYSRPPTAPNEAAVPSNVRLLECPCLPVLGLFVVSPSTSRSTSCSQWDF